ncbi:BTAD domain-containing putative transcriptional regulator [Streptomyces sp. CB01881]|uniref:AfsR/SARP family transcriptional regulator n=1 Tax=Streptomyces sp. CB01881 TaxID=2078691 RepID=UPI000CDC76CB|nr:BTAD domain-containing putative transcriptional regulator [Streptomyces sp. CB01881]AUY53139.1 SARP family transcriptional regulator [Streptomyces sp. CB01881]TYC69294.1 SARP family transcriptional regulator [Streptomyces sp. CB01881]
MEKPQERWELRLFDGFELRSGSERLVLPLNSQRLIALLALRVSTTRGQAGGILWPEAPERQAGGRLRTTLWRVRSTGPAIVERRGGQLSLAAGVDVDVRTWLRSARRALDGQGPAGPLDARTVPLVGDLLPGWYEDWVLVERERLRQLQLHALEEVSAQLLGQGRHAAALEAALSVLHLDPIRESAHRAVIAVHLAEGNLGEARRQSEACRAILLRELGVGPSPLLRALLDGAEDAGDPGHRQAGAALQAPVVSQAGAAPQVPAVPPPGAAGTGMPGVVPAARSAEQPRVDRPRVDRPRVDRPRVGRQPERSAREAERGAEAVPGPAPFAADR